MSLFSFELGCAFCGAMRLVLSKKYEEVNEFLQVRVLEVDVVAPILHLVKLERHIRPYDTRSTCSRSNKVTSVVL